LTYAIGGPTDDPDYVYWLIEQGACPAKATDIQGMTILHFAGVCGHEKIVTMLVGIGFKIILKQLKHQKTEESEIPLPPEYVCEFVRGIPPENREELPGVSSPLYIYYRPTFCGSVDCRKMQTVRKSFKVCAKCGSDSAWTLPKRMYCTTQCAKGDWKKRHKREHEGSNADSVD
jgi:hypothetical protein